MSGPQRNISRLRRLFEIRLQAGIHREAQLLLIPKVWQGYVSVFFGNESKLCLSTAAHILDSLKAAESQVRNALDQDESIATHARLHEVPEEATREVLHALQQEHLAGVAREDERRTVSSASRRNVLERVGLPEVQQFGLSHCEAEEYERRNELQSARQIVAQILQLVMLRIVNGGAQ